MDNSDQGPSDDKSQSARPEFRDQETGPDD
jgi:hypothetical protein